MANIGNQKQYFDFEELCIFNHKIQGIAAGGRSEDKLIILCALHD